jgi:hypothetical protein
MPDRYRRGITVGFVGVAGRKSNRTETPAAGAEDPENPVLPEVTKPDANPFTNL